MYKSVGLIKNCLLLLLCVLCSKWRAWFQCRHVRFSTRACGALLCHTGKWWKRARFCRNWKHFHTKNRDNLFSCPWGEQMGIHRRGLALYTDGKFAACLSYTVARQCLIRPVDLGADRLWFHRRIDLCRRRIVRARHNTTQHAVRWWHQNLSVLRPELSMYKTDRSLPHIAARNFDTPAHLSVGALLKRQVFLDPSVFVDANSSSSSSSSSSIS